MNFKKGCGIGCLGLFSALVILIGAATWYSRGINKEYKAVQKTETALLAATADSNFAPPRDLMLDVGRLDAFLAIRDTLLTKRQDLEAATAEFAREKNSGQSGLKGFLSLLNSGSDLAPIYATYWSLRNQALLVHRMSPAEYVWYYNFTYYKWLGKAPTDGRDTHTTVMPVAIDIPGDVPAETVDLLSPRRLRLETTYSFQLNPIELIFAAEPSK